MRVQDCNWMQLEEYLRADDRIVLPLGSVEQHAYLSLAVDQILSERVSVEAAEPLGVPVLPALPYGITPYFAAYPGSPTLCCRDVRRGAPRAARLARRPGLPALPARERPRRKRRRPASSSRAGRPAARSCRSSGTTGGTHRVRGRWYRRSIPTRATRPGSRTSPGRASPASTRPESASRWSTCRRCARPIRPTHARLLGDGSFGGLYERPDEDVLRVWQAGVEEVRAVLASGWRDA